MATLYLTIPGITNSSEGHWQSLWERKHPGLFKRIEQDEWDGPDRSDWTARIEEVVRANAAGGVILVAHSLGCTAVAHWARTYGTAVKGAFLVAPSDCETEKYRSTFRSTGFDPMPLEPLPFKSLVVASTNDEWVAFERAKEFANAWGSDFVDVGAKGHINAGAGLGEWTEGLNLLKRLD